VPGQILKEVVHTQDDRAQMTEAQIAGSQCLEVVLGGGAILGFANRAFVMPK
jgi:hypothetical protein